MGGLANFRVYLKQAYRVKCASELFD